MTTKFVKFQKFEKIETGVNRKLKAVINQMDRDYRALLKEEGLEGPFIDSQGRPLQFHYLRRDEIEDETQIVLNVFDPEKPHSTMWEPITLRLVDFVIAFERGEYKNLNA